LRHRKKNQSETHSPSIHLILERLYGNVWSTSSTSCFTTTRKEPWYALNKGLGESQDRFAHFEDENNLLSLSGTET
jgi:hypothetical protein